MRKGDKQPMLVPVTVPVKENMKRSLGQSIMDIEKIGKKYKSESIDHTYEGGGVA